MKVDFFFLLGLDNIAHAFYLIDTLLPQKFIDNKSVYEQGAFMTKPLYN